MRIAEYKRIGVNKEQRILHHDAEFDDDGNIIIEAFDETVEVEVPVMGMVYRDATPEEEAQLHVEIPVEEQIEQLKTQLSMTDYKAIKFAEGWLTEEEYAPIKAEREAIREQIRALEK